MDQLEVYGREWVVRYLLQGRKVGVVLSVFRNPLVHLFVYSLWIKWAWSTFNSIGIK